MEQHKSKKSLSSSKHTTTHHNNNKSQLFKVYAAHPHNKQKSKLSNTQKKRKDTYDYQFPQFSIVFKQNGKQSTFKSCINNQITNYSKASECKSSAKKKTERKNQVFGNSTKTKKQKSYRDISLLHQNFIAKVVQDKKCPLQKQYINCIHKVFSVLDIFNKGRISQANINKWVPEPALYFLGKVFQKIRNQRLAVNIVTFEKMCSSLFYETNPEDVQWFIDEIKNIGSLKKSLNYQQQEQNQLSPIQKRVLQQQYIKSNSKQSLSYKKVSFDNVVEQIKAKQMQASHKLQQVKQKRKSVTFHILQQKHVNCQPKSYCQQPSNKRSDKSIIDVSSFDQNDSSTTPSKKSILKNSNKTKEQPKPNRNQDEFKNVQLSDRRIANFTFQLPQLQQHRYPNNGLNRQLQDIYSKYKDRLEQRQHFQPNKPISARYESNQVDYNKTKSIISTQRANAEQDNKRLDQLRNRIQGFLKQNAEKIQNNKSFYQQSCIHH